MMPDALLDPDIFILKSILILLIGGVLIGFGTRYAGGCTSGAISGLSNTNSIIKGRYRILYRRIDYGLFIINF
jgi:hypothetical protein